MRLPTTFLSLGEVLGPVASMTLCVKSGSNLGLERPSSTTAGLGTDIMYCSFLGNCVTDDLITFSGFGITILSVEDAAINEAKS